MSDAVDAAQKQPADPADAGEDECEGPTTRLGEEGGSQRERPELGEHGERHRYVADRP
ncbi:MAG TPA: hypothetical protein VF195_07995 [Actinomycetota bacterium]